MYSQNWIKILKFETQAKNPHIRYQNELKISFTIKYN